MTRARGDPSGKAYYDRRAEEYDDTSYRAMDPAALAPLTEALQALAPGGTLDIGCGTGWLAGFLPVPPDARLVGLDQSARMLEVYRRRHPHAALVRADAPPLPFPDDTFDRCFSGHLFSHLPAAARDRLVAEARRVGRELVVVEQQPPPDRPAEGWERRPLRSGAVHEVFKRYRTATELAADIGGTVLFENHAFIAVRWCRAAPAPPGGRPGGGSCTVAGRGREASR